MRGEAAPSLKIKRVYEPAEKSDGFRVLVDRLWPRGLSKSKAHVDLWLKDLAPSDDLRRRFHGEPTKWREFVAAYAQELKEDSVASAVEDLRERARQGPTTLLYAARDEAHNNAVALKTLIEKSHERPLQERKATAR
jgi:uncharacterized protein YeaO (DUF488 family)